MGQRSNREVTLWNKYGLTLKQYDDLVEDQRGLCAICHQQPIYLSPDAVLHVDHDHETGLVRGLLCTTCNTGLGMFRDNIRLLAQAIVYLERNGKTY